MSISENWIPFRVEEHPNDVRTWISVDLVFKNKEVFFCNRPKRVVFLYSWSMWSRKSTALISACSHGCTTEAREQRCVLVYGRNRERFVFNKSFTPVPFCTKGVAHIGSEKTWFQVMRYTFAHSQNYKMLLCVWQFSTIHGQKWSYVSLCFGSRQLKAAEMNGQTGAQKAKNVKP